MTAGALTCDGGSTDGTRACGALLGCCTLALGASLRCGLMFLNSPYGCVMIRCLVAGSMRTV